MTSSSCRVFSCYLVHLFKFFLKWSWVSCKRNCSSLLSLWWDFCYIVWFPIVFSFLWDTLFNFFQSYSLDRWCLLPITQSNFRFPFLRAFWFFLSLVFQFLPSGVVSRFSLLAECTFRCKILFPSPDCTFSLFVPILFHFLQTDWYCPFTWGEWSFLTN